MKGLLNYEKGFYHENKVNDAIQMRSGLVSWWAQWLIY